MIRREIIGFLFLSRTDFRSLKKAVFFSVEENVSALVKESEPELIIGLVSAAELYHRLIGSNPTSGSAYMRVSQLSGEAYSDTALSTFFLKAPLYLLEVQFTG